MKSEKIICHIQLLSCLFVCLSGTVGCVGVGLESSPKTSLFGGGGRSQRGLPTGSIPMAGNAASPLPARASNSADQFPATGAFMPQLSNSLTGNSSSNGIAQPMVSSPLLFQRLDRNTWRVATPAGQLFQTVARILSQSYIISQADRHALSLSTDWDKFFIDGRLFRNRISVNVFPLSTRSADLVIKNSIEYYAQNGKNTDDNNPTQWLPTQDVTDELDRVLEKTQNQLLANFLNTGSTR
ncbi:hypothetical protein EBR21_04775 [bacterium]|nr:hypothetical protein [bacterium]